MGPLSAAHHINDEGSVLSLLRHHRGWCRHLRDRVAEGHRHLQLQEQMLGKVECGQVRRGHGDGPQNPFLRPSNNPFEKLTRGGDFSDLQSLWRTKRDASEGLVDVDEDDFYEFLQQVQDHRHLKTNSMGNLTCVLQKIGQLTEDMEVNIEYYTTALTAEEAEYGFTFDVEGSAAKDPEWRAKIAAEYNDCHEMAQSWPATSLNRSPMSWRTWRRSTGQRATRRPLRGSPALDCQRTSTTPPPSLLLSCRTLCLKRRSSLKGSSGTSTVTSSSVNKQTWM